MMQLRFGRLVTGALVAELVPIVLLVALVAVLGPPDQQLAEAYAARLGRWVGPIGGAVSALVVAWWVARPATDLEIRHGIAVGGLTALLDSSILVAAGAPFEWLFVISNLGRLIAGTLGGALAARTAPTCSASTLPRG